MYVYIDKNEIDFIIDKKYLIEVKYNAEMSVKQKKLFDEIEVENKLIIANVADALNIDKLLTE